MSTNLKDESLYIIETLPVIVIDYRRFNELVAKHFPGALYEYCFLSENGVGNDMALTRTVKVEDIDGCEEDLEVWATGGRVDPPYVWAIAKELLRRGVFWRSSCFGHGPALSNCRHNLMIRKARFVIEICY